MQDRLDIRVKIKTPQELTLVRDGIIKFIDKDSLFQQKNRLRLRQNSELLTRLNYDILQLDSLQKVKYFEETRNTLPQKRRTIDFPAGTENTISISGDLRSLLSESNDLKLNVIYIKIW